MITAKEARKAVAINRRLDLGSYDLDKYNEVVEGIEEAIKTSTESVANYPLKPIFAKNRAMMDDLRKELKRAGYKYRFLRAGTPRSGKAKLRIYWD